jgi:hypothetical protein
VSKVFDAPGSIVYNVYSKLFGSEHVTRAYTSDMTVDQDGWIEFNLTRKQGSGNHIGRPFHWLHSGILFAMKRHKHKMSGSFGLNHELFAVEWQACCILHWCDEQPFVFMSGHDEWLKEGHAGEQKQELQVFLKVPDHRRLPLAVLPLPAVDWYGKCSNVGVQ